MSRPIFYKDSVTGQLSFENKEVSKLLEAGEYT